MNTTQRAIIWDMDGVLIDSHEAHYTSWRDVLARELGFELTRERFAGLFGIDGYETVRRVMGGSPDPAQVDHVYHEKEELFRTRATSGITMQPGARALIEALDAAGWRQAIATSAPRANLDLVVTTFGLDGVLKTRICLEDVARGKPDPALFTLAAQRLGVPPRQCVVIEDSGGGLEAARAAGMRCVAVATTRAPEALQLADRVYESVAAVQVADLAALLDEQAQHTG